MPTITCYATSSFMILFSLDLMYIAMRKEFHCHQIKDYETFLKKLIEKETQRIYCSWKQIKSQRKKIRRARKGLGELRGEFISVMFSFFQTSLLALTKNVESSDFCQT